MFQHNPNSGYLELILGPMFSGKSSALSKIYKQYTLCDINPLVINHLSDTRYSDSSLNLFTHDQTHIPCCSTTELLDISQTTIDNHKIILINEGQFFKDLKEFVSKFVSPPYNKHIYIAGLDGDYQQKPIGNILELIPMCDKITKLTSLCVDCKNGTPAPFTYRICDSKEQFLVGSSEYKPLCRSCLNTYM
jgi:thymidine kinase